MDINKQQRFIFIKPYETNQGTIPEGSQIDKFRDFYYFNGGMCDSYSNGLFNHIVNSPELKSKYLKEVTIPINKI